MNKKRLQKLAKWYANSFTNKKKFKEYIKRLEKNIKIDEIAMIETMKENDLYLSLLQEELSKINKKTEK